MLHIHSTPKDLRYWVIVPVPESGTGNMIQTGGAKHLLVKRKTIVANGANVRVEKIYKIVCYTFYPMCLVASGPLHLFPNERETYITLNVEQVIVTIVEPHVALVGFSLLGVIDSAINPLVILVNKAIEHS